MPRNCGRTLKTPRALEAVMLTEQRLQDVAREVDVLIEAPVVARPLTLDRLVKLWRGDSLSTGYASPRLVLAVLCRTGDTLAGVKARLGVTSSAEPEIIDCVEAAHQLWQRAGSPRE